MLKGLRFNIGIGDRVRVTLDHSINGAFYIDAWGTVESLMPTGKVDMGWYDLNVRIDAGGDVICVSPENCELLPTEGD